MTKERHIVHDSKDNRFILPLDSGQEAYVTYRWIDEVMNLLHSQVPYEYRGRGIGKDLVEKTFEYINTNKLKAKAICSYIRTVKERNDKWKKIIQ